MPNLERISHLTFIVACAALVSVALAKYVQDGRVTSGRPLHATEGTAVGRTVPPPVGLRFEGADLTVFVAVNSSCQFCTASMPFYGRVTSQARRSTRRIQIIFGSSEPIQVTKAYLSAHGVAAEQIVETPLEYPIRATPTLLVVGGLGNVLHGWTGQLSDDQEKAVLRLLVG
jgi:hypothetical protein